ncbi:hypothetical protein [Streptomyces sp. ISL-100]|uniref:hypothetical protein n=1 Tax=Streptomyces sp. ISL-100 TaxID=2819173 RepID=UPI001BEBD759|nr:hypothetical protein [Streptomyces sp. ISL-100]MBT2401576.1 hypothetical protein [Streptomyces sp. ISL-100]
MSGSKAGARPADGGADLLPLDALGAKGAYRARNRITVTDVSGAATAELSLVPGLFVHRTLTALRRAAPLAPDERAAALRRAPELFATGTVAGQSVTAYEHYVSRVGGVPITVVRTATRSIATRLAAAYQSSRQARPQGTADDWRDRAHPRRPCGVDPARRRLRRERRRQPPRRPQPVARGAGARHCQL